MEVGPTFFLKRGHPHFHYEERKYQQFIQQRWRGEGEGGKEGIGTSSKQGGYGLTFKFHITQLPIARVLGFLGNALE